MSQQIIIKEIQMPREINVYTDIDWLGESLGFFEGRDTKRITAKILQSMLKDISREGYTSSESISNNLDVAVQRVNYHLRSFLEAGFICRQKKQIILRQGSVKAAVEEMRKDANRLFDNLSMIAEEIDKNLGLKNRI
ncbi:MAG: ArsR family transcriptional regulator [Candidatus Woesearchaeota archaeon]